MSRISRWSAVLAIALGTATLFGQNTNSGDIRGTATDATGAVIPGTTVTVTDVDKNVSKTYVTDNAGLYDTGPIVTDHYTLSFTKDGFKTFVRGPVTLDVETLTVDGRLEVGAANETVRVTNDVPLLQTESGSQATIMPEQELQNLPNFASWENFVILMPGTAGSPTGGLSNVDPGQTASVNGNSVFYNVLGDGITMSLPSNGNSYDYNFDTLQEVQMITNGFSAEYENGGMLYNQISKGGSNQYHGDLFEYFQNNDLNAAPYGFGQPTTVPILHANYFGGSVGGYIPWKPFTRKLFFFFNYDYSQDYGGSSYGFETVPTAAMMTGDFTGMPTIYDPTTQTVDASGAVVRRSFASEYGNGNKIPASLLSTVAQNIQKYYPAPNVANPTVTNGVTTNNVYYNIPSNSPGWSYFYRVDYDISQKNRLTATEFYTKGQSNELSNDCPINCTSASNSAITAQLSDVWTFSPDKTNEFRAGLSTQNNLYLPQTLGEGYPSKLGIQWAKADLFPEVNITGACCWELAPGTNAIQHQMMFEPSDVVTVIKGRHVLHFGGEFLNMEVNSTNWGNLDAGSTTFSGAYTESTQGDTTTGLPYADFLLGDVNSWSASNTPEYYLRYKSLQAFLQDDIKLRPNFTLNAGLRWEGWTPNHEKDGNSRLFDPTIVNPAPNPFGVVNTLGAMWYATTHTNGRMNDISSIWDIFLPRLGFAWQERPSTVIRGAIGLFAYNHQIGSQGTGSAFGSSGNEADETNGVLPVLGLDQDGSVNDQGGAGSAINPLYQSAPTTPQALNGQSVYYALYNAPAQKIWQYNLEIQRELGADTAVKVAYVGSHGFDLEFWQDMNQIPLGALGPNDTTGLTDARPYPNFQSISGIQWNAISNYNSLQTTIEKRMRSGVQYNFNYTWSKYLDEGDWCAWNCATNVGQNGYDPRSNYGPAAYDIRSMFKGRIIYMLPFGKGQRFLNNSTLVSEIVGGWQSAATIVWQSGNPFTPIMENNNDYSQAGNQFPDAVTGVSPWSGTHHQIGPTTSWFNVNAFTQPAPGTYGDVGRDTLRGPGLSNVNFSLGKNFSMWRESNFQLRIDSSNVFNHPSFGLPDTTIGPGHIGAINSLTVGGRSVELLGKLSF